MSRPFSKISDSDDLSDVDHIVIGSGIGGLTAATWLAKAGRKVVVLERHYVPGGFTHTFKRKNGFVWDVGVHYVGNVAEGSSLRRLFNFLTSNRLGWESMGEVYDQVTIGKDVYEFHAGKDCWRKKMNSYFPSEAKAIDKYLDLIEKSNKRASAFFFEKTFEPFLSNSLGGILRKRFRKYSDRTTLEVLSNITSNKRLMAVLCAQCGNYGLSPKYSSFGAHALVVGHFLEGGYYPKGGADQIAKKTIATFESNGGKVFINSEVSRIVTEKNRVRGVEVNGRFINCKSVLSNVGVRNTFKALLNEADRKRCRFELNNVEPSTGHMCLYVGLDASGAMLDLPRHNIWYFRNEDFDDTIDNITLESAPEHFAYISFPSAKDPEWANEHPDQSTIQAISVGRYGWLKDYEDQPWRNRDEAYENAKSQFQEKMLERLYELVPQIKGHVVETEVSTPLSTRHFTNHPTGEIYGLAHTPERFNLNILRPKTRIRGLRLVGQDITIVGVAGAMMSGMLAAITILKFRVWKLFREMGKMKD